ncbi:MAG TPA: glycine cleavage system aminomethyltransferase GcvT [Chthoniobacterales bacterium]|nr:glycine cleavage system aminomethyltransferase GcvT [Chthoniobacterales bacterium]
MTQAAEKKTPLYDGHVRLGAKIIPFGGWLMPVHYTSIVEEHQAVRNALGMFDISHMGQFVVEGGDARDWLNRMLTNNLEKLEVGQGQYTFLLNDGGGVIDDLIVYRVAPEKFLLVVNAAKVDEDFDWLNAHRKDAQISFSNRSADFGGVAIQGPRITELSRKLFPDRAELPPRNHIVQLEFEGMPLSVARTGYTGEDGVEVFFRAGDAPTIWNRFLQAGANLGLKPCGLGARDTLRLEMCYPLNGSDLSPDRNPIEAGLGFFVDLKKSEFVGRDALLAVKQSGPAEKLIAFRMTDKGPPPRPHYGVYADAERIGEVTSGTLSPSLNYGVGMAYLPAAAAIPGKNIEIEIRGKRFPATIEKKPLYKKQS